MGSGLGKRYSQETDIIPRTIALILLFTFVTTVVALIVINVCSTYFLNKPEDIDFRKGWFDLLKNSLVLLSTALTTVIGYYFGQRSGEIKSQNTKLEANENIQKAINIAKSTYESRNREASRSGVGDDSPNDLISPLGNVDDIIQPQK